MHGESVGIAVSPTVAIAYLIVAVFMFGLSRVPVSELDRTAPHEAIPEPASAATRGVTFGESSGKARTNQITAARLGNYASARFFGGLRPKIPASAYLMQVNADSDCRAQFLSSRNTAAGLGENIFQGGS